MFYKWNLHMFIIPTQSNNYTEVYFSEKHSRSFLPRMSGHFTVVLDTTQDTHFIKVAEVHIISRLKMLCHLYFIQPVYSWKSVISIFDLLCPLSMRSIFFDISSIVLFNKVISWASIFISSSWNKLRTIWITYYCTYFNYWINQIAFLMMTNTPTFLGCSFSRL